MTVAEDSGSALDSIAEIEVVRAHVHEVGDLARFASVLTDGERERARAYRVSEPRDAFTLARGLLRIELSKRLGIGPSDIHFDLRDSGKPDLKPGAPDRPDWRFSVSHTGPHVAIALCLGTDVGVDIERLDRTVTVLDIARRYFTPAELKSLEAFPANLQNRAFLAGWTRKEAIVKARGHTMAESLATLTVSLDPEEQSPRYEDAPDVPTRPDCRLAAFEVANENLVGAVAIRSRAKPTLRFRVLSDAGFD